MSVHGGGQTKKTNEQTELCTNDIAEAESQTEEQDRR